MATPGAESAVDDCLVCVVFAEIAAGNYTDETVIPGYPVEFFPGGGRGDGQAYDQMNFGGGNVHLFNNSMRYKSRGELCCLIIIVIIIIIVTVISTTVFIVMSS